jgi:hypothetical protein
MRFFWVFLVLTGCIGGGIDEGQPPLAPVGSGGAMDGTAGDGSGGRAVIVMPGAGGAEDGSGGLGGSGGEMGGSGGEMGGSGGEMGGSGGMEPELALADVLPGEWTLMRQYTRTGCLGEPTAWGSDDPQLLDMEITDEIQLYYPSTETVWWEVGTLEGDTWNPDPSPRGNQFTHVTLTMVDPDRFVGSGDHVNPITGCINNTWELELTRR